MTNIFKQLFQYGFHDTEISSIEGKDLDIILKFNNGIYLLDENGKETILSKPMEIILKIDSYFNSFEEAFEIKEYGKKVKYIEYQTLNKYLQEESFGVSMCYYSNFNSCVLFDGGILRRNIMLSIEGISEIIIKNSVNMD